METSPAKTEQKKTAWGGRALETGRATLFVHLLWRCFLSRRLGQDSISSKLARHSFVGHSDGTLAAFVETTTVIRGSRMGPSSFAVFCVTGYGEASSRLCRSNEFYIWLVVMYKMPAELETNVESLIVFLTLVFLSSSFQNNTRLRIHLLFVEPEPDFTILDSEAMVIPVHAWVLA